eukprot:scaffold95674_cov19-Tisochrysis_lutea.AAC.4
MDSSASTPSKLHPAGFTGTPMTGKGVMAAVMPGSFDHCTAGHPNLATGIQVLAGPARRVSGLMEYLLVAQ